MSTGAASDVTDVPTMPCPVCGIDVPVGIFCGRCGAHLTPERGDGPHWLRIWNHAAAPGEHVLRPALASSVLPHLPQRSRTPFRFGLVAVLLALVGFTLLKLPAAMIAVAALGGPLLFGIYLYEADAFRDLPARLLAVTALIGLGLGVVWVTLTGAAVARSYGVPLEAGIAGTRLVRQGLIIPLASTLLMLVSAAVARLLRPPARESLDGFMIGALGALAFTAAATLTRLAPQLPAGVVARTRPFASLLVEAVLRGVAVPLTAAALGGLIGAAVWFTRPANTSDRHKAIVRALIALFAVTVLAVYAVVGLTDVAGFPQLAQLGVHLVVTLLALLLLRIGLHLALLHEAHDPMTGEPLLCPRCEQVVPDMAFCPACGVASRASSRSSRRARRLSRPVRDEDAPTDAHTAPGSALLNIRPGYAVPPGIYRAAAVHRASYFRVLGTWCGSIAVLAASLVGISALVTQLPVKYQCPPKCGRPPIGATVSTNPRFTASGGEFSVSYPAEGTPYEITTYDNGVTAKYVAGDTGTMQLFSQPAGNRTPQDIATALIKKTFPDARTAYVIPNAMVGYQPGYGEVADSWPQGTNSSYAHMRIMVLVAVKDELALVAFAIGPYHQFGPTFGPGPPSGANLELAQDLGKYVNSFAWRGDPSR
ncbi:MAG: zinc ribbon domain-containing protein, partial [Mycobacteriaceae bacterium]